MVMVTNVYIYVHNIIQVKTMTRHKTMFIDTIYKLKNLNNNLFCYLGL